MKLFTYISFLFTFWILIAYISRALQNEISGNDSVFDPSRRDIRTDGSDNIFWFVQVRWLTHIFNVYVFLPFANATGRTCLAKLFNIENMHGCIMKSLYIYLVSISNQVLLISIHIGSYTNRLFEIASCFIYSYEMLTHLHFVIITYCIFKVSLFLLLLIYMQDYDLNPQLI